MSSFIGGECNYGRCKCKNKMGKRCGLCAQEGSMFCHLHKWCSDPANAGMEVNGWVAPMMAPVTMGPAMMSDAYALSLTPEQIMRLKSPSSLSSSGVLTSAVATAATALAAPVAAVVSAASNVADFFVPDLPPVLEQVSEPLMYESGREKYFKSGGACESVVLKIFRRQSYTVMEVEDIYDKSRTLKMYPLEDVMACLRKHKKLSKLMSFTKYPEGTTIPTIPIPVKKVVEAVVSAPLKIVETIVKAPETAGKAIAGLSEVVVEPTAPFVPSTPSPAEIIPVVASAPLAIVNTVVGAFFPSPTTVPEFTAPPPPLPTSLFSPPSDAEIRRMTGELSDSELNEILQENVPIVSDLPAVVAAPIAAPLSILSTVGNFIGNIFTGIGNANAAATEYYEEYDAPPIDEDAYTLLPPRTPRTRRNVYDEE